MKSEHPTIHLITHSHWDREWYLPFQIFRLKLVRMVDHVLSLFDSDPDFRHFMLDGQAIVLEDYLEMRPEREDRLRQLIQQGRILIGPWYVLPDEFLVSPEAIVRNLLIGGRTARRFGPKMMVGYVPDPFGHIGQLPQILSGFGIDSACVMRGLDDQPVEFMWQAPDGTSVFMAYLRDGYGNAAGLPAAEPERFNSEVSRLRDSLSTHSADPEGHVLLMHGTDHTEPPAQTSEAIANFNHSSEKGCLIHSTLPRYISVARQAAAGKPLITVKGELRSSKRTHMLPGVLSARAWIKQRNFTCQTLLEKYAEPLSAWASISIARKQVELDSQPVPVIHDPLPVLHNAWKLLLQNHPHDSICGCSIDQVHNEMRPRFDQVEQIGEELVSQGLTILSLTADTRPPASLDPQPGSAVVVYNPSTCTLTAPVEVTVELPPGKERLEIFDENGKSLPVQAKGLGAQELINVILDAKALRESFGMISAGRINGMVVCSVDVHSGGELAHLDVRLSDTGEPDLDQWNRAVETVNALMEAGKVKSYVVRARSVPSASALLLAEDVPGCGYRTFWVRGTPGLEKAKPPTRIGWLAKAVIPAAAKAARFGSAVRGAFRGMAKAPSPRPGKSIRPPYRIENEYFTVEASAKDGTLAITDKRSGTVFRGLNRFIDGGDCGDEYNYSPPEHDEIVTADFVKQVYLSAGSVQQTLEIELSLDLPGELAPDRKSRSSWRAELPVSTRITLTKGVPRVDVQTWVDNRSIKDHRLRVHFPAPFQVEAAEMDGHYELVRRPIALPPYDSTWAEAPRPEKPQQLFTRISSGKVGLLIANRGLPEIEALNTGGQSELALTLLRCVGWLSRDDFSARRGHAGPFLPTPEAQNLGEHTFAYSIIPYLAENAADAVHQAEAFGAPLRAAAVEKHPGSLPASGSLVSFDPEGFVLTALKPAEDGRGIIVRGYNRTDTALAVRIGVMLVFEKASRVNLQEATLEDLLLKDGTIEITLKPWEILTVRLE